MAEPTKPIEPTAIRNPTVLAAVLGALIAAVASVAGVLGGAYWQHRTDMAELKATIYQTAVGNDPIHAGPIVNRLIESGILPDEHGAICRTIVYPDKQQDCPIVVNDHATTPKK